MFVQHVNRRRVQVVTRLCLTYAEYVRVRLVGRGLGNSPGCSAALSQTRLPSRRNGKDSDSGAERGDRRDGSAGDDSSGSAMIKSVCSLYSRCLQKTTCCGRNTKLTHPLLLFPVTHMLNSVFIDKCSVCVLCSVFYLQWQIFLRVATCSNTAFALTFTLSCTKALCVCVCVWVYMQDSLCPGHEGCVPSSSHTKPCIVFKEALKNTRNHSEISTSLVYIYHFYIKRLCSQ